MLWRLGTNEDVCLPSIPQNQNVTHVKVHDVGIPPPRPSSVSVLML